MDRRPDDRSHNPDELPVEYVDDRRYFRGYALLAVTAEHRDSLHRRIVADINGEYQRRFTATRVGRAAIGAGVLGNAGLFALELAHLVHLI